MTSRTVSRTATSVPGSRPLSPNCSHVPIISRSGRIRHKVKVGVAGGRGFEKAGSRTTVDPFLPAGLRLQRILAVVGDRGEDIQRALLELPVIHRLFICTNKAAMVMAVGIVINLATDEQPFGGISPLTAPSCLLHAVLGVVMAAPLVATSLVGRIPYVRQSFPVLEGLHIAEEKSLEPMMKDLDLAQHVILCTSVFLPTLLILLPVVHGCFHAIGSTLASSLNVFGMEVPSNLGWALGILVPTLASYFFAAAIISGQLHVKPEQREAVEDAMANSDRFFRHQEMLKALQASPPPTSSTSLASLDGESSESRSRRISCAFKAVSAVYLMERTQVAELAFVFTALNISYYAFSWHMTHDLAAPLTCALVAGGAEMSLTKWSLAAKEHIKARMGGSLSS